MSALFNASPIHATALPLASALDRLDRRNDNLPHAPYDHVLAEIGAITGGLSIYGYEHDLTQHLALAQQDEIEDLREEFSEHRPFCDAPDFTGCGAGIDAAQDWLDEANGILEVAGLALRGAEIVPADVRVTA